MVSNSGKNRIKTMTDALEKALAGDTSAVLNLSPQNDELDRLAQIINKLLKKAAKPLPFPIPEKTKTDTSAAGEERYRQIFNSMEESYFEVDLKGNLLFFNDTMVRRINYSPEELKNINFRQFTDAQNAEKAYRAFHKVFLTGKSVKGFNWEIIKKDGGRIDIETSVSLIVDKDGRPSGFRGISRDVSQRKQTEKRLQLITENIHDVIWTRDFDLNYTYVSPSIFRMTGFTPEEIMKIPLKMLVPEHDLVRKMLEDRLGKAKAAPSREKGQTAIFEMEMLRKDGSRFWVEINANFNRDVNGVPFEIIGVTRDITQRKKAEEAFKESEKRYRMIVENMHDAVWTMDLNLRYLYVSPSSRLICGYTPQELVQMSIDKILTPESVDLAAKLLAEEMNRENSAERLDPHRTKSMEMQFIHKNGSRRWVDINATFSRNEAGKPEIIVMAGRDITDRKKAEAEKEKLEKQLHQVQKMETVGRLAGGVAHDFNNMLNVILGYIDLTKLQLPTDSPIASNIQEIEKAACRSRDLTAQLLAFSSKQIIAPRVVNLNKLIEDTQKSIARLIGEDIDLRFFAGGDLWCIKFDPIQAEQILINLAVNARDAMPAGGKLIIETSNVNIDTTYCQSHANIAPGEYVLLTVSDTGSGIDKNHLPYVFEPFYTTKEVGKGTGLGLATVYGIVKQNNGFISVYSEPPRGSTFKIYLPRSTDAEVMTKVIPEPVTMIGSGTILLVEDDEMVLKMVSDMLESMGYMVIASENPQDALSLCEKGAIPIDLVITDVVMPGMSGRALRDKLAVTRPELKILFMSGYTSNIIAHHGILEEGMQFIQKPFTMITLSEKVKQLIDAM